MTVGTLILILTGLLAGMVALALVRGLRATTGTGLTVGARLRLALAVTVHAFWLDAFGVAGSRRVDLSRELAVNLAEAAALTSPREALAAVGSLRRLAAEAVGPPGSPGARWGRAALWAVVAFAVALSAEFVAWTAWVDAAEASGAARLAGDLSLFPGASATFERGAGGAVGLVRLDVGFVVPLAVAAVVLVLTARPWSGLRLRESARRSRIAG